MKFRFAQSVLATTLVAFTSLSLLAADKTVEEGQALAAEIRSQMPVGSLLATGALKVKPAKSPQVEIPLRIETTVNNDTWQTVYQTVADGQGNTEKLTVVYTVNQPPRYVWNAKNLTGNDAMTAFAGSDFWLADLGLDFFHWPQQRLIKREMRRGRSCRVLESITPSPAPGGYARVLSWIDLESGGIVRAEAYGADGKQLKEFKPDEFTKIDGEWQVKELEIRNLQTKSTTTIVFDLKKK